MAHYTREEFEAVGLTPGTCDYSVLSGYWHPCSYHEGYIDGYEMGQEAELRRGLSEQDRRKDLQEQMRKGQL